MMYTLRRALGMAAVCAAMAGLMAGGAAAKTRHARVKLSGPSQLSSTQPFYLVAKGKGKRRHQLLGLFVTRQSSCPAT